MGFGGVQQHEPHPFIPTGRRTSQTWRGARVEWVELRLQVDPPTGSAAHNFFRGMPTTPSFPTAWVPALLADPVVQRATPADSFDVFPVYVTSTVASYAAPLVSSGRTVVRLGSTVAGLRDATARVVKWARTTPGATMPPTDGNFYGWAGGEWRFLGGAR